MSVNFRDRNIFTIPGNMANALVSEPIDLSGAEGYAVHAAWSGVTGSGTAYLQVSNFPDQSNMTQILSSVFTISSASGSDMWNNTIARYRWAQLVWVPATGGAAGVLTGYASVK